MANETPKEILNILRATPTKKEKPIFQFKIPKNKSFHLDHITRIKEL